VSREAYLAEGLRDAAGRLCDVRLSVAGKVRHLAGRGGLAAEQAAADKALAAGPGLPVVLGAGLGAAVERLLATTGGPVAVVDREAPILAASGVRERFAGEARVYWFDDPDPERVLAALTAWQAEHGGAPFRPVAHPVYLRLDPDYYQLLSARIKAAAKADFWGRARYAKFAGGPPRVLLLTTRYFIMGELMAAFGRLGVPHRLLDIGPDARGSAEFMETLLTAILEFKPDFVLTVNHLGVDREGVLAGLLERLSLPLASWFVDNPHLVLSVYEKLVTPWTALFTWDADNLESLRALGFAHVHYLPLAADTARFAPGREGTAPADWRADVSFVGNSMVLKTEKRLEVSDPPEALRRAYPELAAEFGAASERSVVDFLRHRHPELLREYETLGSPERQLAYQTLVTWESTRQYRAECLARIMPFRPLIVGDPGWRQTFAGEGMTWRWHRELNYYQDLPAFYPCSKVNFNATSLQMKGAVNQRVFDVPACGAFLVTDHREQLEALFVPGSEVVFYREPGEIEELVRFYLANDAARRKVVAAGRARVLAEHTYDRRLAQLLTVMREIYG